MSETFPIEDVVVTGQRARGPSPFAELQFPTKGTGTTGEQQQEVGDGTEPTGTPSDEETQCSTPEGRKQWNADAKAKEAAERFRQAALDRFGEIDLQNREFGALICEFSNGLVDLSPIYDGRPILDESGQPIVYSDSMGQPTAPIPTDGCGGGVPIGFVHSHPGLNTGLPSDGDYGYLAYLAYQNGVDVDALSVYVVASHQDAEGRYRDAVSRSRMSEREAANAGTLELEYVNPDAEPCPGDS